MALQTIPDATATEEQPDGQLMAGALAAEYFLTLQDTREQGIVVIPLPISAEGDTPRVPARVHAYVLNPLSTHKEAVMRFWNMSRETATSSRRR